MLFAAALNTGSARASSATVGAVNATATAFVCNPGTVNADTTDVVPADGGTITGFSFAGAAPNANQKLDFLVLRPAGGNNSFTVVGHSGLVTLAVSGNNATPANISVSAGDVLGLWADTSVTNCFRSQTGSSSSQGAVATDPAVGSTVGVATAFAGYDLNESAVLGTTRILTSASPGTALGEISDLAALSNGPGNGTLNFKVYSDAACTALVGQSTVTVTGSAFYPSGAITAGGPGSYFWVVTYTGTDPDDSVTSLCGATGETSTVGPATPILTGTVPARAPASRKVRARATLSGGSQPTGTLAFEAFRSRTCAEPAAFSYRRGVSGDGSYPAGPARLRRGTYYWRLSYSGDANNAAVVSSCGGPGEQLVVTPAPRRHHKRKARLRRA
jgi:hypothetical protein